MRIMNFCKQQRKGKIAFGSNSQLWLLYGAMWETLTNSVNVYRSTLTTHRTTSDRSAALVKSLHFKRRWNHCRNNDQQNA